MAKTEEAIRVTNPGDFQQFAIEVDLIDDPRVEIRPDLLASIKSLRYLINPVYLRKKGKRYEVLWGKHRTACVKHLRGLPRTHDHWEKMPCVIDGQGRGKTANGVRAMSVLIENHVRSTNPVAEMDAIGVLRKAGWDAKRISHSTGMKLRDVQTLIRLRKGLADSTTTALRIGRMSLSTAKAMVKLPEDEQEAVLSASSDKIRGKDVAAAVRARQTSLLARLDGPGPAFSDLTDLANRVDATIGQFAGDERRTLIDAAEILRRKTG